MNNIVANGIDINRREEIEGLFPAGAPRPEDRDRYLEIVFNLLLERNVGGLEQLSNRLRREIRVQGLVIPNNPIEEEADEVRSLYNRIDSYQRILFARVILPAPVHPARQHAEEVERGVFARIINRIKQVANNLLRRNH